LNLFQELQANWRKQGGNLETDRQTDSFYFSTIKIKVLPLVVSCRECEAKMKQVREETISRGAQFEGWRKMWKVKMNLLVETLLGVWMY